VAMLALWCFTEMTMAKENLLAVKA